MQDENTWDTLYEKYPQLFENRHKTSMESCMSFGIECGLGWYDLLSSVCWEIKQHEKNIEMQTKWAKEKNPDYVLDYYPVRFDQVKEKFGGLRIYWSGGDDYINGIIGLAEDMSYRLCETCGNKGKPNAAGWIATLCDGCRNTLL